MHTCTVTFLPGGETATVSEGTDLLSAARAADVQLYNSCGGEGSCGECRVIVRKGDVDSATNSRLSAQELEQGFVLACQTEVKSDVEVEVPPRSRVAWEQILQDADGTGPDVGPVTQVDEVKQGLEMEADADFPLEPLVAKQCLRLTPPTMEDNISDLARLARALRRADGPQRLRPDVSVVRDLGGVLRSDDWTVTATVCRRDGDHELLRVEPGDTASCHLGVVVDVGTTTVVASLVDLSTGKMLGTRAAGNPQRKYGEDVISRIIVAEKEPGLKVLHRAVIATVNQLVATLSEQHGCHTGDVTLLVYAGNTTMTHLFAGIEPSTIRRAPYVPTANFVPDCRAGDLDLHIHPNGRVVCVPGVASFVGGDITAGVLASGIDRSDEICMLIDIGTNGEIVLGNREWLLCCSASAGPAFEGSGVSCGVRAMAGAIQRVQVDRETHEATCKTIRNAPPIGICGSGYVDALAELFKAGILDRQGAIRTGNASKRARDGDSGAEYVLSWAEESETGREAVHPHGPDRFLSYDFRYATDIVITQVDIQNLLRSKGSIYSAAKVLLAKLGMTFDEVDRVYIGGGFGNYLDVDKAVRIGMLPDLPRDRFSFIGNSSLTGARMALRSREALDRVYAVAEQMTNIELCAEPSYMDEYVGSLFLPHTNIDLFPSVKQLLGV